MLTFKFIFAALVLAVIAVFTAYFDGNLINALPVGIIEIQDQLAYAANIASSVMVMGNLFFMDDFIYRIFYLVCVTSFFWTNYRVARGVIDLFK